MTVGRFAQASRDNEAASPSVPRREVRQQRRVPTFGNTSSLVPVPADVRRDRARQSLHVSGGATVAISALRGPFLAALGILAAAGAVAILRWGRA
jgi:hypothetical protein